MSKDEDDNEKNDIKIQVVDLENESVVKPPVEISLPKPEYKIDMDAVRFLQGLRKLFPHENMKDAVDSYYSAVNNEKLAFDDLNVLENILERIGLTTPSAE